MSNNPFTSQTEIYIWSFFINSIGNCSRLNHELLQRLGLTKKNWRHLIAIQMLAVCLSGLLLGFFAGYLVIWFLLY